MPAMQQQAAGRMETAVEMYSELLGTGNAGPPGMRDESTAFMVAQASKAYAAVADWEGLESFFTRLEVNAWPSAARRFLANPPDFFSCLWRPCKLHGQTQQLPPHLQPLPATQ